jgi:DNA repair photolyase
VAKVNAAQRLQQAFDSRGYEPRPMLLGAVTDVYQPAERRLRLTRQVLHVLERYGHACTVITKSSLIERDLDVLASMASNRLMSVVVSVTTLDPELSRVMEPRATAPHRRLQTIERLARAGIPVGVSVSPLIPFINEPELERILAAASSAGATHAFGVVLRLPWEVAPLFQHWLRDHYPERAQRVMARVRDMRGGRDNDSRFGTRMKGEGVWAELLRTRLRLAMHRHGLSSQHPQLDLARFRRPEEAAQARLF